MRRIVMVVLCLILAAWCAWGGEVLKDAEGRTLVPVARVACVPMFEIKDVRCALCRVVGSPEPAFIVKITFVHHDSSPLEVTVTADMQSPFIFRRNVLVENASRVKPNTPTTVLMVSPRALNGDAKFMASITLRPLITFASARAPAD